MVGLRHSCFAHGIPHNQLCHSICCARLVEVETAQLQGEIACAPKIFAPTAESCMRSLESIWRVPAFPQGLERLWPSLKPGRLDRQLPRQIERSAVVMKSAGFKSCPLCGGNTPHRAIITILKQPGT